MADLCPVQWTAALERMRQASKGRPARTEAEEEAQALHEFDASTPCDDPSFLLLPMMSGADQSIAVNEVIPQGMEYGCPKYQDHSGTHLSSPTA